MALIDQTKDDTKTLCWGRADSDPKGFQIVQSDGVTPINISGRSYLLTVNTEKDPAPGSEQFQVVGVITDAAQGLVEFAPTTTDTDITIGTYFYDIQQIDGSGRVKTLIKGKVLIIQDITK